MRVLNAAGRPVAHDAQTLEAALMELASSVDEDMQVSLLGATSLFAWPMCFFR